jgi:hypothetical protein
MRIALKISAIKLILLFCVIFVSGTKAQNAAKFDIGGEYMLFRGEYDYVDNEKMYSSRGGLFIEKPIQLTSLSGNYFTPGLSYKNIYESYGGGGLGAQFSSDLNHQSISGYFKLIHKFNFEVLKPQSIYIGGMFGAQIYTWATGTSSNSDSSNHDRNWSDRYYSEQPSHLFKKVYYGFVAGIEFADKGFIRPAIEVRYYPEFAEYRQTVLRPFELAVNFGIGK